MYEMLLILSKYYKTFCQEYGRELHLSDDEWAIIDEILMCFQPVAKACTKLQKHDIVLSDIYTIFNVCHMELNKIGSFLLIF